MKTLTGKNKLPLPFKHQGAEDYHDFLGKPRDKTFFGVELEYELGVRGRSKGYIEADFENRKPVRKHVNTINKTVGKFGIIKGDGSLTYGTEIASCPTSYERHKYLWDEFFENITGFKLKSRSNCGMHVHVSRDRLTDKQLFDLRQFFSVDENQKFLEKISGRKANQYCNYKAGNNDDEESEELEPYSEKYEAVNVSGSDTVEFRIFKAPTSKQEFLIRLQLVKALISWVKSRKRRTLDAFKKFISTSKQFKELNQFINDVLS